MDQQLHYKEESRSSETRAALLAVANLIIQVNLYNQAFHPSSALLRGNWWVPFCLSASVSVTFFLTFLTTLRDCLKSKRRADAIFLDQEELYHKQRESSCGGGAEGRRRRAMAEAAHYIHYKRYAYTAVVSTALLFFNTLVLYAIFFILKKN